MDVLGGPDNGSNRVNARFQGHGTIYVASLAQEGLGLAPSIRENTLRNLEGIRITKIVTGSYMPSEYLYAHQSIVSAKTSETKYFG